jgi:hypothetical protein
MAEDLPGGQPASGAGLALPDLSKKDLRVGTVGKFGQLAVRKRRTPWVVSRLKMA